MDLKHCLNWLLLLKIIMYENRFFLFYMKEKNDLCDRLLSMQQFIFMIGHVFHIVVFSWIRLGIFYLYHLLNNIWYAKTKLEKKKMKIFFSNRMQCLIISSMFFIGISPMINHGHLYLKSFLN